MRIPTRLIIGFFAAIFAAVLAFAIFQPVKVVPRRAFGPEYVLQALDGTSFTQDHVAGSLVLYGFGYTHDPTGYTESVIDAMESYREAALAVQPDFPLKLALVLFDAQRDTLEARRAYAEAHGLTDPEWVVLGGDAEALKWMIGYGFGLYYEPVPLAELLDEPPADGPPEEYGYLQAERLVLVDWANIVRAEYRLPLDPAITLRDVRLLERERTSSGAARAVNEAAHLLMCYPK